MLLWAFEPGMGFERYVDWALGARMVFVYRQHRFVAIKSGASFGDFMAGRLPELPGGPGPRSGAPLGGRGRGPLGEPGRWARGPWRRRALCHLRPPGRPPAFAGQTPTLKDWTNHIGELWPEVWGRGQAPPHKP
jgi:hypothetical protein